MVGWQYYVDNRDHTTYQVHETRKNVYYYHIEHGGLKMSSYVTCLLSLYRRRNQRFLPQELAGETFEVISAKRTRQPRVRRLPSLKHEKIKALVTYPTEPAVFLSQAPGYSRGESPVVGAQEDVVVCHQRSAANGHDTSGGIHLNQRNKSNERAERHKNSKLRKYNSLQSSLRSGRWHADSR